MKIKESKPYSLTDEFLKAWNPINFPYMTEKDKTQLYLIKNVITGLYKIGITNNYEQRIIEVRNATGCPITLLFLLKFDLIGIDIGAIWIEHFLHNYFKHKKTFGEWFNLSKKDIVSIHSFFSYELEIGSRIY